MGIAGAPPRVLYVGQLHREKGVATLIEALHQLAATAPVSTTIAGTGPDEGALRRWPRAGRRGTFLGKVAHAALPRIYREHDIFVFPSLGSEPFGLTPIEAMASGTSVISTNVGGHGELIRHEENALAFKTNDAASLASQLVRMIAEPGLAERLATTARAEVEKSFTMERYVAELEGLLAEACHRARSGALPTPRSSRASDPRAPVSRAP